MEAIRFKKTPWTIVWDEKCSTVDEASKVSIDAQHRRRALAGAAVGTPFVCQFPSGPSLEIDLQPQEAVSVDCVFCFSIGLMTHKYT